MGACMEHHVSRFARREYFTKSEAAGTGRWVLVTRFVRLLFFVRVREAGGYWYCFWWFIRCPTFADK